ncbi:MAG: hypothetical protein R3B96_18090 [Pirellulaceae bacterium]
MSPLPSGDGDSAQVGGSRERSLEGSTFTGGRPVWQPRLDQPPRHPQARCLPSPRAANPYAGPAYQNQGRPMQQGGGPSNSGRAVTSLVCGIIDLSSP